VDAFIEEPDDAPVDEVDEAAEVAPTVTERILELPPGVVFFVAATFVAVVGFAVWYGRRRNR